FKKQRKEENIEKGKIEIEKGIKDLGYTSKEVLTNENIKRVCEKFNFVNEEDLYAAVGYQGITGSLIVTRLTDQLRREREQEKNMEQQIEEVQSNVSEKPTSINKTDSGVEVAGIDNMLVRLSRCCNPVPNDDIVGYITKGRGVSVHRADCPNVQSPEAKERFLEVSWKNPKYSSKDFHLDLEISGYDRNGLLNEVLQVVNETQTQIASVSGRAVKNKIAHIHITVLIKNTDHLHHVVERIKQVKDI